MVWGFNRIITSVVQQWFKESKLEGPSFTLLLGMFVTGIQLEIDHTISG